MSQQAVTLRDISRVQHKFHCCLRIAERGGSRVCAGVTQRLRRAYWRFATHLPVALPPDVAVWNSLLDDCDTILFDFVWVYAATQGVDKGGLVSFIQDTLQRATGSSQPEVQHELAVLQKLPDATLIVYHALLIRTIMACETPACIQNLEAAQKV